MIYGEILCIIVGQWILIQQHIALLKADDVATMLRNLYVIRPVFYSCLVLSTILGFVIYFVVCKYLHNCHGSQCGHLVFSNSIYMICFVSSITQINSWKLLVENNLPAPLILKYLVKHLLCNSYSSCTLTDTIYNVLEVKKIPKLLIFFCSCLTKHKLITNLAGSMSIRSMRLIV